MSTGFSNEKSSEYVILNDLYNKIKTKCNFFYPIVFQKRRDDTMLSLENEMQDLRMIICFSRRSKINNINDENIEITFRETLFNHSNYFSKIGIQSLIGVPIGSNIEEIGYGANCMWFKPSKNINSDFVSIRVDKSNLKIKVESRHIRAISDIEVTNALKASKVYSWKDIISIIQKWNEEDYYKSQGIFGYTINGQRPIFVIYRLKK